MDKLYKVNTDFKEYVDRYSKTRGISTEEALKHELVRVVAIMYCSCGEKENDNVV